VRVGSESVSTVEGQGQWSTAFERRCRGRKEDEGVEGKEEEVGDDGAVTGGEGKCSKMGVGGREGGDGSS
jgi:hypothetical protein